MIANEQSQVIEVGQLLISTKVLDPQQLDQDGSIDEYGDSLDDDSVLGQAGVRTNVTEVVTKEVVEAHQAVKYSSLLSFMLKYTSLLTQGFEMNKNTHEKLLEFGAQLVWRIYRRAISSYLDVDTSKNQYRLLNPTPLDCISGYVLQDVVGDRYVKGLPHRSLNLINVSISNYFYNLNSPERLDLINKSNNFASVLGDIYINLLG